MADETDHVKVYESDVQGAINVICNGVPMRVPCTIHKIETRHPNGRIDVKLQVPTLDMGVKKEQ